MRTQFGCILIIEAFVSVVLVNSLPAEERIRWDKWAPGDKGPTAAIVLVSSVIDDTQMLVTPLTCPQSLYPEQMADPELRAIAGGMSDLWSAPSGASETIAQRGVLEFTLAFNALQRDDILHFRKLFRREWREKRFIIAGVPTYGYLEDQVVFISGFAIISQTRDVGGNTLCKADIRGNLRPPPRTQHDPFEYLRDINYWSWRPGMVGSAKVNVSIARVLDKDKALVVPTYYDIYTASGIVDSSKQMQLRNEIHDGIPPRSSRLVSDAFERAFILAGVDTGRIVDGVSIEINGMLRIEHSETRGTALVRKLLPLESEEAMRRVDYQERKASFEASDGTEVAAVPLSIKKDADGDFVVEMLIESGTVDSTPLSTFSKRGQSHIRQYLGKSKRNKKR